VSQSALKKAGIQKQDLDRRIQKLIPAGQPISLSTVSQMDNLRKAIALGFGEQICLYLQNHSNLSYFYLIYICITPPLRMGMTRTNDRFIRLFH
jgi:hypothetical protein